MAPGRVAMAITATWDIQHGRPMLGTFTRIGAAAAAIALLAACSDHTDPTTPLRVASSSARADRGGPGDPTAVAALVRQLAASRGIVPMPPKPHVRDELVRLGQALVFDKILSGNHDVSCMTCHLPAYATGDDKSLSVGAGGTGLGPDRQPPSGGFIPRNAPPLFNMAAMKNLFWDGRVSADAHGHVSTPAGAQVTAAMQRVFEFGAISAQPMFPVTSRAEMRGNSGNELSAISDDDLPAIWAGIMKRLGQIPEYREMFEAAYPGTRFDDMTFAHASNAIAGFIIDQYTFENSPWDRFLAGNDHALTPKQLDGAQTFLTLKCSVCHTGATLSDDQFHNVAVPQIGPGEGDGASGHDDFGRMRVTGNPADRYRFRTTPLRNVELTAPYGHDGSVTTLRSFIEHYSQSYLKLQSYTTSLLVPALRNTLLANASAILAARDTLLDGVVFDDTITDELMQYMSALTDDAARNLSRTVPKRVPSRLPIDR